MSRGRAPERRWHVGDACQVPTYLRVKPPGRSGICWTNAKVVAVRGDRVIVQQYGFETEHPGWELREPARHLGHAMARVLNRFGHDRHRRTA